MQWSDVDRHAERVWMVFIGGALAAGAVWASGDRPTWSVVAMGVLAGVVTLPLRATVLRICERALERAGHESLSINAAMCVASFAAGYFLMTIAIDASGI